jgi:hypothetical protein
MPATVFQLPPATSSLKTQDTKATISPYATTRLVHHPTNRPKVDANFQILQPSNHQAIAATDPSAVQEKHRSSNQGRQHRVGVRTGSLASTKVHGVAAVLLVNNLHIGSKKPMGIGQWISKESLHTRVWINEQ